MYWETYAYIVDGKIKDIAVFDPQGAYSNANLLCKSIYGQSSYAINIDDYPVIIGDTVTSDGEFYRGRVKIEKVDTISDRILDLEMALAEVASIAVEGLSDG